MTRHTNIIKRDMKDMESRYCRRTVKALMTITVKASGNDYYLSASQTVKCVVTVK